MLRIKTMDSWQKIIFFVFVVALPCTASTIKAFADYGRFDQVVNLSVYQMAQKDCRDDCQAKSILNAIRGSILIGDNESSLLFANLGLQKLQQKEHRQKLYLLSAYTNLIDGNWLSYKKLEDYLSEDERLRMVGLAQIDSPYLGKRMIIESPNLVSVLGTDSNKSFWTDYQARPLKSPWIAGIANLLIPGGGYAYLGMWQTAALNLFLAGVCVISSAEMFNRKMYASGLAVASVGSVFYLGGAFGAARSANDINQKSLSDIAGKLRLQLLPELNFEF